MISDDEQPRGSKTQSHSFSSLPDEIAENIFARVSKFEYPSLSLVSKRFNSLLSSPELYKTRALIGTTEPCLYVCLKHTEHQPPECYSLWMKPVDKTLTNHDNDHSLPHDDYSLGPVPSSNHILEPYYCMVTVGSELYVIGGSCKAPSSAVRILDCRTHTWRDGPSMLVARGGVYAFLLDESIYVMSRWESHEALDWIEVLDIKTQTWRHVRSHGADRFENNWFVINVFEGKIYAIGATRNYVYDPQESRWGVVEAYKSRCFRFIIAWCEIEGVTYRFKNCGTACGMTLASARDWIRVMGSDLELLRTHRTCKLACASVLSVRNLGGKLLVMWTRFARDKRVRTIWCAKIALEKRGSEVWGKIEWANSVSESWWFSSCVVSI